MSSNADPISKIAIITAKENWQSNQNNAKVVTCSQRGHDGDLYESSWRSKGRRFVCFEKEANSDYVVTDLLIVRDDEEIPRGYSGIFLTADTREKSLKKHILCVKNEARTTATKSISDIVLINQSKGERADSNYYTISHEINELNITFCVSPISHPTTVSMPKTTSAPRFNEMPLQTAGPRTNSFRSTTPSTPKSPVSGIEGVPFEINPKFDVTSMTNDPFLASIQIMSVEEINEKFNYNFNVENETVRKP